MKSKLCCFIVHYNEAPSSIVTTFGGGKIYLFGQFWLLRSIYTVRDRGLVAFAKECLNKTN